MWASWADQFSKYVVKTEKHENQTDDNPRHYFCLFLMMTARTAVLGDSTGGTLRRQRWLTALETNENVAIPGMARNPL
jgi:hypothetical protein